MSFECRDCFAGARFRCPSDFDLHFQSRGPCEVCRKSTVCADCPTGHVADQIYAEHPELLDMK